LSYPLLFRIYWNPFPSRSRARWRAPVGAVCRRRQTIGPARVGARSDKVCTKVLNLSLQLWTDIGNSCHYRPAMFVRYRPLYTYTVLQSVRTVQGPRQRCVAHWSGTPSLAEAILARGTRLAEAEKTRASYRRHIETGFANLDWKKQRFMEANAVRIEAELGREIERLQNAIEGLEAARAKLGDWVDPVERPSDAAWFGKSPQERESILREVRRQRRWDRRNADARRKDEERERWLEGMMQMAL
jgi:hypothetical protein